MRLSFLGFILLTLVFSLFFVKETGKAFVVTNIASENIATEKQNAAQLYDAVHTEQHFDENEDDCCDVDCCDGNCVCIANACSPFASLIADIGISQVVFSIESVYSPYSENSEFLPNSHYRPPRIIS